MGRSALGVLASSRAVKEVMLLRRDLPVEVRWCEAEGARIARRVLEGSDRRLSYRAAGYKTAAAAAAALVGSYSGGEFLVARRIVAESLVRQAGRRRDRIT